MAKSRQIIMATKLDVTVEVGPNNQLYVVPTQTIGNQKWEELSKFALTVNENWNSLKFDSPEEDFYRGQIVYVRLESFWTRAKISEVWVMPSSPHLEVFLIDLGRAHRVEDVYKNVVKVPHPDCLKIEGFAMEFELSGVEPIEKSVNYVNMKATHKKCVNWTSGSMEFIKLLLRLATQIKADILPFHDGNRAVSGDLFLFLKNEDLKPHGLCVKSQPISLSKILCKKKLAKMIHPDPQVSSGIPKKNFVVRIENEFVATTCEESDEKAQASLSIDSTIPSLNTTARSSWSEDEIRSNIPPVTPALRRPVMNFQQYLNKAETRDPREPLTNQPELKSQLTRAVKKKLHKRSFEKSNLGSDSDGIEIPDDFKQFLKLTPSVEATTKKMTVSEMLKRKVTQNPAPVVLPLKEAESQRNSAIIQAPKGKFLNDNQFVIVHKDVSARNYKPVSSIRELGFRVDYRGRLKDLDMESACHPMQKDMWPITSQALPLVAVGGQQKQNLLQGRIGGWLVPLMNNLLNGDFYSPPSDSPLVVIVCPEWKSAVEIHGLCLELGNGIIVGNDAKKLSVGCIYANEKKYSAQLSNGCHMLVTTPMSLVRMVDPKANLVSLERCCHLVFEQAEESFEEFSEQVELIMKQYIRFRQKHEREPNQVILSCNEWRPAVGQFVQIFMLRSDIIGPYIILGHPLEALVYSQLRMKTQVFDKAGGKLQYLVEHLLLQFPKYHRVVLCKNVASVLKVGDFLAKHNLTSTLVHEELSAYDMKELTNHWHSDAGRVLVVSDEAYMDHIQLTHLDLVVHYDYPATKRKFAYRFFHMKKCVVSIYETESKERASNCYLLVDPDDSLALRTLAYLLKRCKTDVDPKLVGLLKALHYSEASEKAKAPLCENLKLSGVCDFVKRRCKNRHFITKADEKAVALISGTIEFKVKTILSCSHYLVQLKRIKNGKGEVVIDYAKIALKLLRLNKLSSSAQKLEDIIKIGDRLVIQDIDQCWKRVEIMSKDEKSVAILFIDEARIEKLRANDVSFYEVPSELSEDLVPRISAYVVLLNIRPKDKHPFWPTEAETLLEQAFFDEKETICRSEFVLTLDNTFWIKRLQILEKITSQSSGIQWTPIVEVKEKLEEFGEENIDHSEHLLKICQKSPLSPNTYSSLAKWVQIWLDQGDQTLPIRKTQMKKQYPVFTGFRNAFLDLHALNLVVVITEIHDPFHFFVTQTMFNTQLKSLEKALKEEYLEFKDDDFQPVENQICIAPYEDQFVRVQYLGPNEYLFVDYGSVSSVEARVAPISQRSLEILPFQAIQCSLANIKPDVGSEWSEEAIDCFVSEFLDAELWLNNAEKMDGYYSVDLTMPQTCQMVTQFLTEKGYGQLIVRLIDMSKFIMPNSEESIDDEDELKNGAIEAIELEKPQLVLPIPNQAPVHKKLKTLKIPANLPSLAITENMADVSKLPDQVSWGQDSPVSTYFKVNFFGVSLRPQNAFIHVETKSLDLSYLDIDAEDKCTLFKIPTLALYSEVVPSETKLSFTSNGIVIQLKKARPMFWPRPCQSGQVFKWIKHCYDNAGDSSCSDTEMPKIDIANVRAVDDSSSETDSDSEATDSDEIFMGVDKPALDVELIS